MRRLRVGVIYGGRSGEHEVSQASAAAVIANLDPSRYDTIPLYIHRDGRWSIPSAPPQSISAADTITQAQLGAGAAATARPTSTERQVQLTSYPSRGGLIDVRADGTPAVDLPSLDVVFPVLHGPYGEDGTVQGLLELANVPYVGAGVAASAVGMDKILQKAVFAAQGLPVVNHVAVLRRDILAHPAATVDRLLARFVGPVFVKPANLGSSVGISKVKQAADLLPALCDAAQYDRRVLVEYAVPNAREIECGVLGNETPDASVPGEIVPAGEFYDYHAKYLSEGSQLHIPAALTDDETRRIRQLSLDAYRAIDAAGLARVDFLMSRDTGEVFVNEVNTMPGFTTISMYPKLWEASGVPYAQLLDRLIALALERHVEKQALRTSAL